MGVVAHLGAGQMDSVVVQLSTSARCVRTIDCVVMLIDVTRQMCAAGRMGHLKGLVAHLLVVGAGAWHGGMMRCDSDLTITSVTQPPTDPALLPRIRVPSFGGRTGLG